MCLYADEATTLKAKKSRKGTAIRYKVLEKIPTKLNEDGCVLHSMWYNKKWEPGVIKSNRTRAKIEKIPYEVNRGIHVFVNKQTAINECQSYQVVLPVRCHIDDLIGANKNHEAYYQVFVAEKDYKAAIKGKGKCSAIKM